MDAYRYLHEIVMQQISNIVYNSSQQGMTINKNDILDSLISIMQSYNEVVDKEDQIAIEDFRNR